AISNIAHLVTAAAHLCQSCVVPAGARSTVSPFPRVVSLLRKLKVTVLACLPIQALLIAETAELMGFDPKVDFPDLRSLCTAGEPLSPAKRKVLTGIWGVPVYDNYGMTEIGAAVVDCEYGRPHPLEDYFLFEILQDDLKNHAEPGETGFLVVTTLRRNGTPMIRYLTGDRARLTEEECSCGNIRKLEIHGRIEHTIMVESRRFDLWDLEEIVFQLPCRRFWAVGPVPGGLHFVIENESDSEVSPELLRELEETYEVKIQVTVVPKGTLYDRDELLSIGVVGKPQYIYTAQEMAEQKYLKSARI
ncbi:MAG TPA: CoF synthetase, partial [Firmicutes bacterium]|nr:CoF synthetase [Bacillota bacterium]